MPINPLSSTLRAKKLGVLLRDARLSSGRSLAECASWLGISSDQYEHYELGEQSPSLPELEILSFYLQVPVEHFWEQESTTIGKKAINPADLVRLSGLRRRTIGALLRQARLQSGLSMEQLAAEMGTDADKMRAYELGEDPLPLPVLEAMADRLGRPIKDFQDQRSSVGTWADRQRALDIIAELPPELQTFISKPVNRPYLELAQRLSEMSVEKLRAVGEGILDITL